ncbi:MAG TPA: ADP-ribosylglycohydrolase family protein [Planctomycetota bacterium]|nr:ADP-ribosylglycohydrolase family protein [Planctomycetota bacterium]
MTAVNTLRSLIEEEIVQLAEEGCDVHVTAASLEQAAANAESLNEIYSQLRKSTVRADFPYKEPSDIEAIRKQRPDGQRQMNVRASAKKLTDRLHGAWLGRIAGCMLGKPVEGRSHKWIQAGLENANAWPLDDYFPRKLRDADGKAVDLAADCCRGGVHAGVSDDDTNYTIVALKLMETKGYGFKTEDVGALWLSLLPYHAVCTAERQAYANLINELPIEEVPLHLNPYREYIGAQIRGDLFGYATPGNPELAAELAWRDAALSHRKNGIYGEMFVAAMLAAALVLDDVEQVIKAGLCQIPRKSRLAEAAGDVLTWHGEQADWQAALNLVMEKYGHYSMVHTINNAAIVLLALLYGEMDFTKTIGIAVMCGLDTDCNGATAGSICGAMLGAKEIPSNWTWPLNDTLLSTVSGFGENRISDLVKRTKRLWR